MGKIKVLGAVLLGAAVLIVVLQNTAPVQTRLLFWSWEMSQAALLISTLLAGFVFGALATGWLVRKSRKESKH